MRIIDNKKIDLTEDEWQLYQNIVASYTTATNKGEDYFKELFETNKDGIIVFLRPPSKRQTSLEIFLFLVAVFQQQHVREMYKKVEDIAEQFKAKEQILNEKLEKLK